MPRSVRADRADCALIEPTFGEGETRDAEIFRTASENLRRVLRPFGSAPESLLAFRAGALWTHHGLVLGVAVALASTTEVS
jgi:hypothetical protein